MTFLSDFNALGFRVQEVREFLARHDIELGLKPDSDTPAEAAAAPTWPDWCKALAARPLLTLYEAASALVGIDPGAPGWPPEEISAEISTWETTLERAIQAGELPRLTVPAVNDNDRPAIRPADFAAWCARVPGGLAYPLPGPQTLPATDPALQEALAAAEDARNDLDAKLATAEAERDEARRERDARDLLANKLAAELAAVKQGLEARPDTDVKAAQEWKRQLAELQDIKARYIEEMQRLRRAAAEYEAMRAELTRDGEVEARRQGDAADVLSLLKTYLVGEHGEQRHALAAESTALPERGTLVRPVPALRAQEEAILQTLASMGYDPLRLPARKPGKPGVRAAVHRAIGRAGMWSGSTVFDKAWKRLRADGRIAGGE